MRKILPWINIAQGTNALVMMALSTASTETTTAGRDMRVCVSMKEYKGRLVAFSKLPAFGQYVTHTFGGAMTGIVVPNQKASMNHSPSPSLSKREKASLNSAICSSVSWSAMVYSCRYFQCEMKFKTRRGGVVEGQDGERAKRGAGL